MLSRFNTRSARLLHQMRRRDDRRALKRRIATVKVRLKINPALLNDRPHPLVQGMPIRDRVLSILAHSDDDDALGRARGVGEKAGAMQAVTSLNAGHEPGLNPRN